MVTFDDHGKYAVPRNRNDVWMAFADKYANGKPCELCGCGDWWIHSNGSGDVLAIQNLGRQFLLPIGVMSCKSCHHVRMFAISSVLDAAGFGPEWKEPA